jgi:hypothetical protein
MKKVESPCDLDSDPMIEILSSSLSLEASRFLAGIFKKQKPKGRKWNFDSEILALSLFKHCLKFCILLHTPLFLPFRWFMQSVLDIFSFRMGIRAHVFGARTAEHFW